MNVTGIQSTLCVWSRIRTSFGRAVVFESLSGDGRWLLRVIGVLLFLIFSPISNRILVAEGRPGNISGMSLATEHCLDCHGDEPEAGFSMQELLQQGFQREDGEKWKRMIEAVETGFMPPQGSSTISLSQRKSLVQFLENELAAPTVQLPPPQARRLTRLEYNNTLRDLLKFDRDILVLSERIPISRDYFDTTPGGLRESFLINTFAPEAKGKAIFQRVNLPPDKKSDSGFSNDVEVLSIDSNRIQSYLDLATAVVRDESSLVRSRVLRELLATPPCITWSHLLALVIPGGIWLVARRNLSSSRYWLICLVALAAAVASQNWLEYHGDYESAAIVLAIAILAVWYGDSVATDSRHKTLRLAIMALIHGSLACLVYRFRGADFAIGIWLVLPAIVITITRSKRRTAIVFVVLSVLPIGIYSVGLVALDQPIEFFLVGLRRSAAFDRSGILHAWLPTLVVVSIAVSVFCIAVVTRRFGIHCFNVVAFFAVAGVAVMPIGENHMFPGMGDSVAKPSRHHRVASSRIHAFTEAAFRSPVSDEITQPFREIFLAAVNDGVGFREAMSQSLIAILISPRTLFRFDSPATAREERPWELASRLSYFLWKTSPDEQLLLAARQGRLTDESHLREEVQRLLDDSRAKEFIEDFCVQWLQLARLQTARPDEELYPEYYGDPDDDDKASLATPMLVEPILLFEDLLLSGDSVLRLLDSNFTFVNQELASIYGIEELTPELIAEKPDWKTGRLWHRIDTSDMNRGGLPTMAGPLTLTSFSDRTSPVRRGIWVLDALFNRPPNEPNAAASFEREDEVHGETMREKLTRHRQDSACASCHDLIDPIGFAFEGFGPIGQVRQKDNGEPIDSSGVLATGESFQGANSFKVAIVEQREAFVRGFLEKLMTYAIGRQLTVRDRLVVTDIIEELAPADYPITKLIEAVVVSPQFRCRQDGGRGN